MLNRSFKYLLIILLFSLTSCVSVYFEEPQPVDSSNLDEIPADFQGTWIEKNDTTIINETTFSNVEWKFKPLTQKELDTTKSLLIKGGLIFDLSQDSVKGFNYSTRNDTIIVHIPDRFDFSLSDSVLLKPISDTYFSLNFKRDSIWWEVYIFSRNSNNEIIARKLKRKDFTILKSVTHNKDVEVIIEPYDKNKLTTSEDQQFLNAKLTKNTMLDFINQGGFSDTILTLSPSNKVQ
jgi:hypothetical protein